MSTIEKKAVKAGKYVNTEHVDALIRNYKTERWMQNSERIGKEDTLGLWLSLEEVEEFLQTSKMYGADGVRICFGVYGGNAQAPKPGMEGKQTIALVATSSEMDNSGNQVNKDLYTRRNGDSSILAYNMIVWPMTPDVNAPAPTTTVLGSLMVADKEKGLQII